MQFNTKAVYKLGDGEESGRQKQVSRQVLNHITKAVLNFQAGGVFILKGGCSDREGGCIYQHPICIADLRDR